MALNDSGAQTDHRDVIILGGGLAGLTLALQLKHRFNDLDILVLERNEHPLPLAAHKVGESTVEIGARYLADVVGIREHLVNEHLRKFSLRYFFSHGCERLEDATELGVAEHLPWSSFQMDRGILENFLGEEVLRHHIDFRPGCKVRRFEIGAGETPHQVEYSHGEDTHTATARWLVDASGRSSLLKHQLDLAEDNEHHALAAWFRINTPIKIDDFIDDPAWRAQCNPQARWLSTNHMMGPGYWVWLIPLSSGAHSIGIVADSTMHSLDDFRSFDKALAWLKRMQPAVAAHIEPHADKLLDYRFLRKFSHGAAQVFSADRWAMTGEAGVFPDPFYSPGSDFIGISNTYIAALIEKDRQGRALEPWAGACQDLYFSFYENTMSLYTGQYPIFGNARVMSQKITWDYSFYWGVLCLLVFQNRLTDMLMLGNAQDSLQEVMALNRRMQELFARWHEATRDIENPSLGLLNQSGLEWFVELNRQLGARMPDDTIQQQLRENVNLLLGLADAIIDQASQDDPSLAAPPSGHPKPRLLVAAA